MSDKQLLILRHAKSAWSTDADNDFERPLNKRGLQDAPKMGRWLRNSGLYPDHVISSPAMRAWQTVAGVCQTLQYPIENVDFDQRFYLADRRMLFRVIKEIPDTSSSLLVVGHNPGMEDLIEYLLGDDTPITDDGKLLPTATLFVIELTRDWSSLKQGQGKLKLCQRPKLVKFQ